MVSLVRMPFYLLSRRPYFNVVVIRLGFITGSVINN